MSYGTKYRVRWKDIVGRECVVLAQKQDYKAGVTDLLAAETAVEIEWGEQERQDLTEPFMVSSLQLGVVGTADAETMLEEISDTPDQEWRLTYSEGGELFWQGFIAGDLSGANPNRPRETIEVEAIDGLALLENYDAYTDGGQVSAAISRLLRGGIGYTGLHALPIYTSMDWRPYDVVPDGKCPLDVLSTPEKAYQELNDQREVEGTLDAQTHLEGISERFGLQLFQAGGAWHLRQRDQIEDGASLKRWKMPSGQPSFNDSPTTADVTAQLPHQLRRTEKPQRRVHRLRSLESAFQYDELGELAQNGSFEDQLQQWDVQNGTGSEGTTLVSTPLYDDVSFLDTPSVQGDKCLLKVDPPVIDDDPDPEVEQVAEAAVFDAGPEASYRFEFDVGGLLPFLEFRIEGDDTTYYLEHGEIEVLEEALQAEDGKIVTRPVLGSGMIIPKGATLPIYDLEPTDPVRIGTVKLSEAARGEDTELQGNIPDGVKQGQKVIYWYWTTAQSSIGSPEWSLPSKSVSDRMTPQQIDVPQRTPNGEKVVGQPALRTKTTSSADGVGLDHVSMKIFRAGEAIEETDYIAVDDQAGRNVKLTHRVGDGPVAGHPRGITIDTQQILEDWAPGPGYGQTGFGLEQLLAQQWMRQQRETLDRRTFQFQERGAQIGPQHVYELESTPYTVTYLTYSKSSSGNGGTIEVTEKKDAGVADLTRDRCILALQGPEVHETLEEATGLEHPGRFRLTELPEQEGFVSGTGYTGEEGVEFVVDPEHAKALWSDLVDAGADPAGLGARDTLRLEKGFPLAGNEFDPPVTPVEAQMLWAIDLEHDFVGRSEVVTRREAGPERVLTGVKLQEKGIPRRDCPVLQDGDRVGRISSGTMSPSLDVGIGLAYLEPEVAEEGAEIAVEVRERELSALIEEAPFL